MKRILIYLVTWFLMLGLLCSCENTDYQIYDKNDKNKLFFGQDTIRFTYGMNKDQEIDLKIDVKLIGFADENEDKTFLVKAVAEKTTAVSDVHYTLNELNKVYKDSANIYVPLDFHKSRLEKNKTYCLTLELVENENYKPTNIRECVIFFDNKDIEKPVWWQSAKLGDYNQEKFILFVSYFHEAEALSPVIYASIKATWGENLDKGTATNLLTVYKYQGFINRYILSPMYDYYLDSQDPMYQIPNPNY